MENILNFLRNEILNLDSIDNEINKWRKFFPRYIKKKKRTKLEKNQVEKFINDDNFTMQKI